MAGSNENASIYNLSWDIQASIVDDNRGLDSLF